MLIFGIILFTLLSAIFSGTEIAFISANRVGIEFVKNKDSLKAKAITSFYNKPKQFIGVLLIGNNISLVILTFLFSKLLDPFISILINNDLGLLVIKTFIITIFILIFAEFLPKTIFRAYPNKSLKALTYPIYFFNILLKIPTLFFTFISTIILKYIFKTKIIEDDIQLTRIDLENFIEKNISEDDDIEKEMFQKVLNLCMIRSLKRRKFKKLMT
jgi:Mg2+/Co2+ transporter CorB